MRILIADESVAATKALRPFFKGSPATKSAGRKTLKGAPAAGKVVVSFPAAKRSGRDAERSVCPCSNLDLGDQPELAAVILDALGIALVNLGCLDEGGPLIEQARDIRRNFFGADHPATAASQISYARLQRERGNYFEEEKAARDALRINRAVFGDAGLPVAASLNEFGICQLRLGNFAAAQSLATEGLDILNVLGSDVVDPNTTRLLDLRGRAETELGKFDEAATTFGELLALDTKELGTTNHPKYAAHVSSSGMVWEAQGNLKQAEKSYRQAIDIFESSLNRACHPNLPDAYANLGALLRAPGRPRKNLEKAGDLFHKALRMDQQIRSDAHPFVADDLGNVGRWQYDTGDRKGAETSFEKSVKIFEKNVDGGRLPADDVFLARAHMWYGRVLVERGTVTAAEKAEPLLEKSVAHWPKQPVIGAQNAAIAGVCLGRSLYLQKKDLPRAQQLLRDGYPNVVTVYGANSEFAKRVEDWLDAANNSGGSGQSAPPSTKSPRRTK